MTKVLKSATPEKPKPTIRVDDKSVKTMAGKKVGDNVKFMVSGRITSMNQYEKEPVNFSIELSKIKEISGDKWGDYKKYLK